MSRTIGWTAGFPGVTVQTPWSGKAGGFVLQLVRTSGLALCPKGSVGLVLWLPGSLSRLPGQAGLSLSLEAGQGC